MMVLVKKTICSMIVLVTILLINSCKIHSNDIIGEWISVDYPNVLNFEDNCKFEYIQLNEKDNQEFRYIIDSESRIMLNDSIFFAKILMIKNNLMILQDSSVKKSYLKINDYNLKTSINEVDKLLTSNIWKLNNNENQLRLEFIDESFSSDSILKKYLRINEYKGNDSFDTEWWLIKEYKNSYFLVLSTDQLDAQIYQLKDVTDTLIIAETFNNDKIESISLVKQKKVSTEYFNRINKIIAGFWQITDYEKINCVKKDLNRRFYNPKDSVNKILEEYYKSRKINYFFSSNGKCSMNAGEKNIRNAYWKLSSDCTYINTENGWMRSMQIISITDSIMIIEKHEIIEFDENNGWNEVYMQERLTKVPSANRSLK